MLVLVYLNDTNFIASREQLSQKAKHWYQKNAKSKTMKMNPFFTFKHPFESKHIGCPAISQLLIKIMEAWGFRVFLALSSLFWGSKVGTSFPTQTLYPTCPICLVRIEKRKKEENCVEFECACTFDWMKLCEIF